MQMSTPVVSSKSKAESKKIFCLNIKNMKIKEFEFCIMSF